MRDRLNAIAFEVEIAALASAAGSLTATAFFFGEEAWNGLSLATVIPYILVWFVTTATALIVAFPSTLLIGLLISWCLRRWIIQYPLPSAVGVGLIGAFAGRAINTLDQSLASKQFDTTAMVCGAVAGSTWAFLHWKYRGEADALQ